ncbi:IMP dehydrogenase [Cohnella thailandensis]|uniref:IMP dehydrogenase n=1 Tax=Cohnella thailandensis TaxID=557557 RepID=A0A841SXJ2_9BACL|nr:IMP dehydrogenase [Cohnella thailandensis]MBB6635992.1 IMP dehydrogenase [Cohnella thailandensis]MBP1976370.1 IMP dehydrogenase [Cohnella thailandensis]
MAFYYEQPSRTFNEYLLVPGLTRKINIPDNVNLQAPVTRFKKGEKPALMMNLPIASSIMQAVSDANMAIGLAKCGGISFIYGSQSIEKQAEMVRRVKKFKAGFVMSASNLRPEDTLKDVLALKARTGHGTIAITEDGAPNGKLMGIVTSRDYRESRTPLSSPVSEFMTPFSSLIYAEEGITLSEANDMIWEHKLNSLPIVDKNGSLLYLVFRKDYDSQKENPLELHDENKQLIAGAGINTRDYAQRVPALLDAGADILCIDSSDGYSEWQAETIRFVKETYGAKAKIGAGNVVDRDGFLYLAEAGADFVKVGIGGGSICITREQKGIGRGQASAVIEVAAARQEYYEKTGIYVPICSDGGIVHDYHITLALAMGADFVMLGRYFARFDEAPGRKLLVNGNFVKEYWGEGSSRARNWQRYDFGSAAKESKLEFEEGVDSFIPYAGRLKDNLDITVSKIKSTMCNCGALTISELQEKAKITLVSSTSIVEGGAHDVILKEQERTS